MCCFTSRAPAAPHRLELLASALMLEVALVLFVPLYRDLPILPLTRAYSSLSTGTRLLLHTASMGEPPSCSRERSMQTIRFLSCRATRRNTRLYIFRATVIAQPF